MREDNLQAGSLLASYYKKNYGVITYSGTLALELALITSGLSKGSKVIVSNIVCSSIINTIIKLGLEPVIVCPKNELTLTISDIDFVMQKFNPSCLLLVHQYGIVNHVKNIKKKYPSLIIIEDVAQAFGIKIGNTMVGLDSDYIVTSFGKTKPLSNGIGGAIFSNNEDIIFNTDFCDIVSRNSKITLYSYAFPLCHELNLSNLIQRANKIVERQRMISYLFVDIFKNNSKINYYHDLKNDESVWHRFPIWIEDHNYFQFFIRLLDKYEIGYQLPHDIDTQNLINIQQNSIIIDNRLTKRNFILLRTRIDDVNQFKEKISKMYRDLINYV